MKKITSFAACVTAALSLMFSGCKTAVDPVEAEAIATSIGSAAGLVVKMTGKADTNTLEMIVFVAEQVSAAVPETNVSFVVAWAPVADKIVAQLIEDGKIQDSIGGIIKSGVNTLALAVDYAFDKYPEWKSSQELTSVVLRGLVTGFKATVSPGANLKAANYDEEALAYLIKATR